MTTLTSTTVTCDWLDCQEALTFGGTALAGPRAAGWYFGSLHDYCPEHSA